MRARSFVAALLRMTVGRGVSEGEREAAGGEVRFRVNGFLAALGMTTGSGQECPSYGRRRAQVCPPSSTAGGVGRPRPTGGGCAACHRLETCANPGVGREGRGVLGRRHVAKPFGAPEAT